jgi:hypothetical protein
MYLSGLSGKVVGRPPWEGHRAGWVGAYGRYAPLGMNDTPEVIQKKQEDYAFKKFTERYPVEKGYDRFERFLNRASTEFKDDYFMFISAVGQDEILDAQIKKYKLEDQLVYKSKQQVYNHMHPGYGRRLCMYIFKFNKEFHFE